MSDYTPFEFPQYSDFITRYRGLFCKIAEKNQLDISDVKSIAGEAYWLARLGFDATRGVKPETYIIDIVIKMAGREQGNNPPAFDAIFDADRIPDRLDEEDEIDFAYAEARISGLADQPQQICKAVLAGEKVWEIAEKSGLTSRRIRQLMQQACEMLGGQEVCHV